MCVDCAGILSKFWRDFLRFMEITQVRQFIPMRLRKCRIANAWAGLEVGVGLNSREVGLRLKDSKVLVQGIHSITERTRLN